MYYYIGYYNCDNIRNEERITSLASENKMNYIISVLCNILDESFVVVSPAETRLNKYIKGKSQELRNGVILKTFPSINSNFKLLRILGHLLTRISFVFFLLLKVNEKDHLIVYHSLAYMRVLKWIKQIKKCQLTLEVEELYADVTENEQLRKKELEYLQIADSYLFITELLKNEVNRNKKSIISHGTYEPVPVYNFKFNDEKIHIVYAGTFNQTKGGVYTALSIAEYLDDRFVIEILGQGSEAETQAVKKKIKDIVAKSTCGINFVGLKTGDDFNAYIQACQIGLSTQQLDAKLNATSFPSKILMYMSNGIKVLSVRIPAVETSLVGNYINYYDLQDPKAIAEKIKLMQMHEEYDSRTILNKLHEEFTDKMRYLLDL